ncbi:MAG: TIGR02221 family CRISPR-associated protein [Clostridiales bacterium]|jgi:CRISPR-associated Csx2 family protein|nr:TIGR02221 family CRISPR-associated protein [Clostridiales bacterium]
MAKVLIASIGNGAPLAAGKKEAADVHEHAYRPAKYYNAGSPNGNVYDTPLVSVALMKMYDIDEIILVGTAGSSWDSLYGYMFFERGSLPMRKDKNAKYDDEYHYRLLKMFNDSDNLQTRETVDSTREILSQLKETIGDYCREIVVLEYGTTPDELLLNLNLLNQISNSLKDNDIIYFDISHAFRSLPYYELLAVNLAKSSSRVNVKIEMVSYGMFEASKLYDGKTPIVDMTQLIELLDWTRAVEEFNRYGKFDLFKELLGKENQIGKYIKEQISEVAWNAFEKMTNIMASDIYMSDTKDNLKTMLYEAGAALSNRNHYFDMPILISIKNVMKQVTDFFRPYNQSQSSLCVAFTLWKLQKEQTVLGAILLMDAIECMCLEILGKNLYGKKAHKVIHEKLNDYAYEYEKGNFDNAFFQNNHFKEFIKKFKIARDHRNDVAHVDKPQSDKISKELQETAEWVLDTYNERVEGKPGRTALQEALK